MSEDKEVYERKRIHDLYNHLYSLDAANQLTQEKIDNLLKDLSETSVDTKSLLKDLQTYMVRLHTLENQVSVYNKVVWTAFTTAVAAIGAWFFKS
jgi:hypothetical protein